jgi:hypothetical protein
MERHQPIVRLKKSFCPRDLKPRRLSFVAPVLLHQVSGFFSGWPRERKLRGEGTPPTRTLTEQNQRSGQRGPTFKKSRSCPRPYPLGAAATTLPYSRERDPALQLVIGCGFQIPRCSGHCSILKLTLFFSRGNCCFRKHATQLSFIREIHPKRRQ